MSSPPEESKAAGGSHGRPTGCWGMICRALFVRLPSAQASSTNSRGATATLDKNLTDDYAFGKKLGQGAFGVVNSCTKIGTCEMYAVKSICLADMSPDDIKQEADMLERLAHPCTVKLRNVYYEKMFVHLVLDFYEGGDMIDGVASHWKNNGALPIPVVQNLSKMMVQAVAWLHHKNVVHRDLKGDNFLLDGQAVEHPDCRIFLSDFGTATDLEPGQRASQKCGTKMYWAPEFYDLDYGIAVDMWAIGVIMYGLVSARFPFKGENDCKTKPLRCPGRLTKDGESFLLATLAKDETMRMTAREALEHTFLSSIESAAQVAEKFDF